jgi:hypothetical protein
VIWTDEVTFEVGKDSRNIWVTRRPGEEYLEKNLKPSFKSGRVSISAWDAICGDVVGPLVFLTDSGHMNAKFYTNEIMERHLQPFWKKI